MSCCVQRVDGQAPGGNVIPPASTEVYSIDFAELPNAAIADGPVVLGDRTWTAAGVTLYASSANVVNGQGIVFVTNNSGFNQWNSAALDALRIESTFANIDPDFDPTTRYAWEMELGANTAAAFGAQCRAIIGIVKRTAVEPGTDQSAAGVINGRNNTGTNGTGLQSETTTAAVVTAYAYPATSVMRICNTPGSPSSVAGYVAPPNGSGDWPAGNTYGETGYTSSAAVPANLTTANRYASNGQNEVHLVCASSTGLGFSITIRRFRVLRLL